MPVINVWRYVRASGNDAKWLRYCMSLEERHKNGDSEEHILDDAACRFAERVRTAVKQ